MHTDDSAVPRRYLALAWASVWGALVCAATLGPVAHQRTLALAALLAAGAAWACAIWTARRAAPPFAALVIGAAVLRLTTLCAEPELSGDAARYAWEAEVVASGKSPWTFAPDAPELAALRERLPELHAAVEHASLPSLYPPFAELSFTVARGFTELLPEAAFESSAARALFALRLLFALCDLALLWPLRRLCANLSVPESGLVAWAFCPLAALEFAGSGHCDSLALLLWIAGLAACTAPRSAGRASVAGAACIAAAGLVKLLPLASLPFALRRRRAWLAAALAALVLALGLAYAARLEGARWALPAGAAEYAFRWESQSLLYRFVQPWFERHYLLDESSTDPRRLARMVMIGLWAACAVWLWIRRADVVSASAALVGSFLVLTPTLHPWYVCWMVPFLALRPRASWIWLAASAPLCYWPIARWKLDLVWHEPVWLWPAIALPFFALLIRELAVPVRSRSSSDAPA